MIPVTVYQTQDYSNSIASALELQQSCIWLSMYNSLRPGDRYVRATCVIMGSGVTAILH